MEKIEVPGAKGKKQVTKADMLIYIKFRLLVIALKCCKQLHEYK